MNENIQMDKNIVIIPVEMEHRSIDEIAKEAALRIIEATDTIAKQRETGIWNGD